MILDPQEPCSAEQDFFPPLATTGNPAMNFTVFMALLLNFKPEVPGFPLEEGRILICLFLFISQYWEKIINININIIMSYYILMYLYNNDMIINNIIIIKLIYSTII